MTLQTEAAPRPPGIRTGAPHSAVEPGTPGGGEDPVFLTTAEAAAVIRCHPDYVARQCAAGNLVAKKVGKEWRVHRDDLEAFMRGGKAPPARAGRSRKRAK